MIFLLLKLPAYNEKKIISHKTSQHAFPWTGTSRTDTWKPHQAETSSNCIWNMKLGAREKQIPNKTWNYTAQLSNRNLCSYFCILPDFSPLSEAYFKNTFNLPTPISKQTSKKSRLDGHLPLLMQYRFRRCTSKPQPLLQHPAVQTLFQSFEAALMVSSICK